MTNPIQSTARKATHNNIILNEDAPANKIMTGLKPYVFQHQTLPAFDLDEIDTTGLSAPSLLVEWDYASLREEMLALS